jgi:acyl-CoA synthetase (NDP forming)
MELLGKSLQGARAQGRNTLDEHEVYAALQAHGISVPEHAYLPADGSLQLPGPLAQGPVVVKIVSPQILHKTEVQGVRFMEGTAVTPAFLRGFMEEVGRRHAEVHGQAASLAGVLVARRVAFDATRLSSEILVGMRWSRDFGFVGIVGLGGVKVEVWGGLLPRGAGTALFALTPGGQEEALREIRATLVSRDLTGGLRGSKAVLGEDAFRPVVTFLQDVAAAFPPVSDTAGAPAVVEMEFNPFLVGQDGHLVPVDALVRTGTSVARPPARPVDKLEHLFHPRSVAIVGVSSKSVNMGRVMLRNLLRDGFSKERLFLVKPGDDRIDDVQCWPSARELPERVDLAVLAVAAPAVPDLMEEVVTHRKAESIVVIPGGMAETSGGASLQARVEAVVRRSRAEPWRGPVVCGPNSMGVSSFPAGCDTTFIPACKLPRPQGARRNVAVVSQSGAFALSRLNKETAVAARYMVTAGNQMDATIGDYVGYLKDDPDVDVLAVYVEGFQEGDGARFVAAARAAVTAGKTVILYKGGRSPEGQGASAGHTASVAGDYRVTWHLCRAAGVLLAESFEDFEGLLRLAALLSHKEARGNGAAFMSNAGFEAVGMADNVRGDDHALSVVHLSDQTTQRVKAALAQNKIDALVDVHNPLDITPVAPDSVHLACARAVLEDPGVHVLVMGLVPFSPAMSTVEKGDEPHESLTHPGSLALELPKLAAETNKMVVVVVDAGSYYDPLARMLERGGLPVFRAADRAVRLLGRYVGARARHA